MDVLHYFRVVPVAIWPVVFTHFILNIVNCTSRHVEKAFFRTLVFCADSTEGTMPSMRGLSHGRHAWTGSDHCRDANAVLRDGLLVEGQMWFLTVMLHVPLVPLIAAAADRWGRRPVLIIGILGFIAFLLLLAGSQMWDSTFAYGFPVQSASLPLHSVQFNVPWFACLAFAFRGITFNFGVVWMSMIFDLTDDVASRACSFAMLEVSNQIGETIGGLLAAHIEHLQLLDYSRIYAGFACICGVALLHVIGNVPESMPTESPGLDETDHSNGLGANRSNKHGLSQIFVASWWTLIGDIRKMVSDVRLLPLYLGEFLGSLGSGSDLMVVAMTITAYGWKQGDFELYQAPCPLVILLSTMVIVPLLSSRFDGCVPEWFLCSTCAANVMVMTLAAFAPIHPFFLLVPRFLASLLAFQTPMLNARLTDLVSSTAQAKLVALRAACSSLASGLGYQIFTSGYFFDPTRHGWLAMSPFITSSVFGILSAFAVLVVTAPRSFGHYVLPASLVQKSRIKRHFDTVGKSTYGSQRDPEIHEKALI